MIKLFCCPRLTNISGRLSAGPRALSRLIMIIILIFWLMSWPIAGWRRSFSQSRRSGIYCIRWSLPRMILRNWMKGSGMSGLRMCSLIRRGISRRVICSRGQVKLTATPRPCTTMIALTFPHNNPNPPAKAAHNASSTNSKHNLSASAWPLSRPPPSKT